MKLLGAIAWNAILEALHKRLLYVFLGVGALVAAVPIAADQYAAGMGSKQMDPLAQLTWLAYNLTAATRTWGWCAMILAIIFGAGVISWETSTRTIVPLLAKPVRRWQFLLGRWLGQLLLVFGFMTAGFVFLGVIAWRWNLALSPILAAGILGLYLKVWMGSALAMALSVLVHSLPASGLAWLVVDLLARIPPDFQEMQPGLTRSCTKVLYYLAPSHLPYDPISGSALLRQALELEWGLVGMVALENLLYGLMAFLLAVALFEIRDLSWGR